MRGEWGRLAGREHGRGWDRARDGWANLNTPSPPFFTEAFSCSCKTENKLTDHYNVHVKISYMWSGVDKIIIHVEQGAK